MSATEEQHGVRMSLLVNIYKDEKPSSLSHVPAEFVNTISKDRRNISKRDNKFFSKLTAAKLRLSYTIDSRRTSVNLKRRGNRLVDVNDLFLLKEHMPGDTGGIPLASLRRVVQNVKKSIEKQTKNKNIYHGVSLRY